MQQSGILTSIQSYVDTLKPYEKLNKHIDMFKVKEYLRCYSKKNEQELMYSFIDIWTTLESYPNLFRSDNYLKYVGDHFHLLTPQKVLICTQMLVQQCNIYLADEI